MTCTLDFVQTVFADSSDPSRLLFEPDGSLATEFVLMEQIYEKIQLDGSNDALWCHLAGEEAKRREFFVLS